MKLMVVLAAMIGLASAATTQWPEYDCHDDHRPVPDNPHAYEVSDRAGNWHMYMCRPEILVFDEGRCYCVADNCSDVNRLSQASPGLDYMYEYWHSGDNAWNEMNCHDIFPTGFLHNNAYLFFNETGCRCDWKPGHPEYVAPDTPDQYPLVVDIEMDQKPPVDAEGNSVQPNCAVWWELANEGGRECMRCNNCSLKSWYLTGNEMKDVCLYFGLYSTAQDDPSQYKVVLSDSCASIIAEDTIVFEPTFLFEYRATPMSFRVTYRGGVWSSSPGGSRIDRWVDVALSYRAGSWFTLYVDGVNGNLVESSAPDDWVDYQNPFFKISGNCQLNICGNPLNYGSKYTGCVYWFQVRVGRQCPIDVRP